MLPAGHDLAATHVGRRREDLDDDARDRLDAALKGDAAKHVLPGVPLERSSAGDPAFAVEIAPFFAAGSELPFRRLRSYALQQLELMQSLLPGGWALADAHPDNVAWRDGAPRQADWGSFVPHSAGSPWGALKQFMECFACPLAVSASRQVPCGALLAGFPDGIPTHYARRLIPWGFRMRHPFLAALLAAGSRESAMAAGGAGKRPAQRDDAGLLWTLRRLAKLVGGLEPPRHGSYWGGYEPPYSRAGVAMRERWLKDLVSGCAGGWAAEIGANNGQHTRILATGGRPVVAVEPDPDCADALAQEFGEGDVHVVVADMTDGRPARRQPPLVERIAHLRPEIAVAMAVLHHMSSLHGIDAAVGALARIGARATVIEWIPPDDGSVAEMRARSLLADYGREAFDRAIGRHFPGAGLEVAPVPDSGREIVLIRRSPRVVSDPAQNGRKSRCKSKGEGTGDRGD